MERPAYGSHNGPIPVNIQAKAAPIQKTVRREHPALSRFQRFSSLPLTSRAVPASSLPLDEAVGFLMLRLSADR